MMSTLSGARLQVRDVRFLAAAAMAAAAAATGNDKTGRGRRF